MFHDKCFVPEARLELARSCDRGILSPLCLPFHHPGFRVYAFNQVSKKYHFFSPFASASAVRKNNIFQKLESYYFKCVIFFI